MSNIQLLICLCSWIVFYLKNEYIKVVYTDIRNAYDSVSHKRLLEIMSQFGQHESLTNRFNKFLNGRLQKVVINDTLSDPLTLYK